MAKKLAIGKHNATELLNLIISGELGIQRVAKILERISLTFGDCEHKLTKEYGVLKDELEPKLEELSNKIVTMNRVLRVLSCNGYKLTHNQQGRIQGSGFDLVQMAYVYRSFICVVNLFL